MKTLMRNGRDRRSENPLLGHAKKERVVLIGTDQRITSGPAAKRPQSKAEYMTAPERFADNSQIPLAPRAPSIHDPERTLGAWLGTWASYRLLIYLNITRTFALTLGAKASPVAFQLVG